MYLLYLRTYVSMIPNELLQDNGTIVNTGHHVLPNVTVMLLICLWHCLIRMYDQRQASPAQASPLHMIL